MRNLKIFFGGMLAVVSMLSGCDKGFDELNINRVDPTTLDPQFIMNRAITETTYPDNLQHLRC